MELLREAFSLVCGQTHSITLGGLPLPACERCTGLYVTAVYAFLIVVVMRPAPSAALRWTHGLMLVAMAPFGYHLVEHGESVRIASGQLFAFGTVYYLSLLPAARALRWRERKRVKAAYFVLLATAFPLLLLVTRFGAHWIGIVLAWLTALGAGLLVLLVVANLIEFGAMLRSSFSRRPSYLA